MVPLWLLGVCLGGLHLPQTHGVPADSEAALADIIIEDPSGLVERDYLYGDSSGIQHSEDLDSNDDDLQKSALKKCGTVPMVAHGSSKVLQRKATYTCNEGYALLGNESIICDAEGQWSQAPLCLPTPKFFPGPKGEPSDPGLMGAKGEPGDAGAMGPIGPPGIAGRKGVRGARGPSGIPGTRGGKGSPGLPGPGGANGRKGLNGAKGIDSDPGATGPPGPQGSQGEPGYKGEPGDPGDPGAPGLSITWSRSAFCVKLGTGSVVNNQAIGFQEILYNEESDYNIANSTFVCHVAGVYAFHAYFEVNTRNAQIAIMVNDQCIYHNYQSYSSYPELSTVGTIVRLKVGDKVWVQPIDSDTGICRNSYFMGYLIYDSK